MRKQISCTLFVQLNSAFVFTIYIYIVVQSLYFLNLKFQASSYLLWLYSRVLCQTWSKTSCFLMTLLKYEQPNDKLISDFRGLRSALVTILCVSMKNLWVLCYTWSDSKDWSGLQAYQSSLGVYVLFDAYATLCSYMSCGMRKPVFFFGKV